MLREPYTYRSLFFGPVKFEKINQRKGIGGNGTLCKQVLQNRLELGLNNSLGLSSLDFVCIGPSTFRGYCLPDDQSAFELVVPLCQFTISL